MVQKHKLSKLALLDFGINLKDETDLNGSSRTEDREGKDSPDLGGVL